MARERTGQTEIAAIGTAVVLPTRAGQIFALTAHPSNVGTVWIGNDGNNTVSATTGFPLTAGAPIALAVANLGQLWVVGGNVGDRVCWIVLEE